MGLPSLHTWRTSHMGTKRPSVWVPRAAAYRWKAARSARTLAPSCKLPNRPGRRIPPPVGANIAEFDVQSILEQTPDFAFSPHEVATW